MLPTIVCIEDNKVKCQHNGLNDIDGNGYRVALHSKVHIASSSPAHDMVMPLSGSGKYTTGMLEFLLSAADGMLDDAPFYEQEQREAEEEEFDNDDD